MKRFSLSLALVAVLLWAGAVSAHFGMIIPSQDVVLEKGASEVKLTLSFSHPMEMQGMDMAKPEQFGVVEAGKKTDLLAGLKETKVMGKKAWAASHALKQPGVYGFFMVPAPYWEPAEDCFIQHLTKVVVPAFGEEEGWNEPVGLKTEIVPLTRPFGNYAGNVFSGQVLVDGKPAPGVTVEVEYYNADKKYEAPNDYMVTQSVATDVNGVFVYVVPWAGWWGFAALTTSDAKLKHEGQDKDVELGAVLWTKFVEPKRQKK